MLTVSFAVQKLLSLIRSYLFIFVSISIPCVVLRILTAQCKYILVVTSHLRLCAGRPPWPPSHPSGAGSLSHALIFIGSLEHQEEI